jgi:hypothetical protein
MKKKTRKKKIINFKFFNILVLYIIYYINIHFINSDTCRHFIDVNMAH